MNLEQARQVIIATHLAAIKMNVRAATYELQSGPGVGKTDTVGASGVDMARALDEPFGMTSLMPASMQSPDVRGFMIPRIVEKGTRPISVFSVPPWVPGHTNTVIFMPDGEILYPPHDPSVIIPRFGVVYLDEFGQGEDDTKKALAELLLHGQVGDDRLPVGWRVLAASNRMKDRSGVLRPLAFITNRRGVLNIEGNPETWSDWANGLPEDRRLHYMTLSFARQQPHLVFQDEVPPGDDPYCTPRSLVMMDRQLMALRTDEEIRRNLVPTDAVAKEVAAGLIGGPTASQYFVHVRYADELPTIEAIMRDPERAKLPEKRDAQMVCALMLTGYVERRTLENIVAYMSRLSTEMQVLAVKTMTRHTEKGALLASNPVYRDWLIKNKVPLTAAGA